LIDDPKTCRSSRASRAPMKVQT